MKISLEENVTVPDLKKKYHISDNVANSRLKIVREKFNLMTMQPVTWGMYYTVFEQFMKNVTIDFDGTLQRPDVQEFVKLIMGLEDVTVYVLTARFDELHKQKWIDSPTNQNLYAVTDKLGIGRERIRFQNFRPKWEYLHGANVAVHLDDCNVEIEGINLNTNVPCVDVKNGSWENRMMDEINKPLRIQLPPVPGEITL